MADESCIFEVVLLQKGFNVVGEGGVVVDFVVRGVAMVARVDSIYGTVESTG